MTHPRNKRHREQLRKTHGKRRLVSWSPLTEMGAAWTERRICRLGNTGRPCSCWLCKRPRCERASQLSNFSGQFE